MAKSRERIIQENNVDKNLIKMLKDFLGRNQYHLEFHPAKGGVKKPFAILCPGGGYGMVCSFVEGRPIADALNAKGYSVFILRYRVGKKAAFPNPQNDLARAVKEVIEHADEFNVKKDGYMIFGGSAGGHLAASFGTESMGFAKYGLPKPGALVLSYPVITMDESGHQGSTENLLGKDASDEKKAKTSIQNCITENYPPVYVWNSDADTEVPPVNSALLDDALTKKGIKHIYRKWDNVPHGSGLAKGTDAEHWLDEAVAFWEECYSEK